MVPPPISIPTSLNSSNLHNQSSTTTITTSTSSVIITKPPPPPPLPPPPSHPRNSSNWLHSSSSSLAHSCGNHGALGSLSSINRQSHAPPLPPPPPPLPPSNPNLSAHGSHARAAFLRSSHPHDPCSSRSSISSPSSSMLQSHNHHTSMHPPQLPLSLNHSSFNHQASSTSGYNSDSNALSSNGGSNQTNTFNICCHNQNHNNVNYNHCSMNSGSSVSCSMLQHCSSVLNSHHHHNNPTGSAMSDSGHYNQAGVHGHNQITNTNNSNTNSCCPINVPSSNNISSTSNRCQSSNSSTQVPIIGANCSMSLLPTPWSTTISKNLLFNNPDSGCNESLRGTASPLSTLSTSGLVGHSDLHHQHNSAKIQTSQNHHTNNSHRNHHNISNKDRFPSNSSLSSSQPHDPSYAGSRSLCGHQSLGSSSQFGASSMTSNTHPSSSNSLQQQRNHTVANHCNRGYLKTNSSCNHSHNHQHQFCDHRLGGCTGNSSPCNIGNYNPVVDPGHGCCNHNHSSHLSHPTQISSAIHHHHHSDLTGSDCVSRCPPELAISSTEHPNQIFPNHHNQHHDASSLSLTASHIHNLSNSSTTTHASNVAVKNQPVSSTKVIEGTTSSKQQDQYSQSSAASNTSSNHNHHAIPVCITNPIVSYPGNQTNSSTRRNQPPLPPALPKLTHHPPRVPPPLPPPVALSSLVQSSVSNHQLVQTLPGQKPLPPSPPPHQISQPIQPFNTNSKQFQGPLPPLPPKLISSTSSVPSTLLSQQQQQDMSTSNSTSSSFIPNHATTHVTTLRTESSSPNSADHPITRVTSQAGVQNPLPDSDIPPPLPPLNIVSRAQVLVNLANNYRNATQTSQSSVKSDAFSSSLGSSGQRQQQPLVPETALNMNNFPERKSDTFVQKQINSSSSSSAKPFIDVHQHQQQQSSSIQPTGTKNFTSGIEVGNLSSPVDICPKCNMKVSPSQEACRAMNKIYHASCFYCTQCCKTLVGEKFYPVGDKIFCEEDFEYTESIKTMERCASCLTPIHNMILSAMGKCYHPKCFKCCICGECLDGVKFTIDLKEKIYCVKDYHSIFSPKCAACGKSISPVEGTDEIVRVVSMGKDYHIDCYRCEDCGLQLTDEEPNQSYPLDNHLLCQRCHINRLGQMQAGLNIC